MKVGFLGLLTLLFVGLKLTNFIAWSWLWVLSPLWFGPAVFLIVLVVSLLVQAVVGK